MCYNEKLIIQFYKKHTECKHCKGKKKLKRYSNFKEKFSNQRNVCYEKNIYYSSKTIDVYFLKTYLNPMWK